MMFRRAAAAIVGVSLLSGATPARADSAIERNTLKGMTGVQVLVEELSPEAENAGLTTGQLHADVERQLQQSGIAVVAPATLAPDLYVNVNVIRVSALPLYAYDIHVGVNQTATVLLNGVVTVGAETWSTSIIGVVGTDHFATAVRQQLRGRIDAFITAFRLVNPK